MALSKIKIVKTIMLLAVMALLFLAASWAWLSTGELTPIKQNLYTSLPFPAFFVDGHAVSMKTYIARYRLMEKIQPLSSVPEILNLKKAAYERLVDETKLELIAGKLGVKATDRQIEEEYALTGFADQLKAKEIDEQIYKNDFLKPDLNASNLVVWFYGQENLNQETYNLAEEIISKMLAGQKIEDLAKTYNKDETGKMVAGDAGFIYTSDLLPEIQQQLANEKIGETKIVPTRYGIYILKLEQRDNKGENGRERIHLRQIYLSGSDFNAWYKNEEQKYKVINIIKI